MYMNRQIYKEADSKDINYISKFPYIEKIITYLIKAII